MHTNSEEGRQDGRWCEDKHVLKTLMGPCKITGSKMIARQKTLRMHWKDHLKEWRVDRGDYRLGAVRDVRPALPASAAAEQPQCARWVWARIQAKDRQLSTTPIWQG